VGLAEKRFSFFRSNTNPKRSSYRPEWAQESSWKLQEHREVAADPALTPRTCRSLPNEVQNLRSLVLADAIGSAACSYRKAHSQRSCPLKD
jgi:hypothetical protein